MKLGKIHILYLIFLAILTTQGCSLDFPPEDEISDPDAITSVITAQKALATAYASYQEYNYALDLVVLSDDMQPTPLLANNPGLRNTYLWNEIALLPLSETIWTGHYETIAKINVLLERIPNIKALAGKETKELSLINSRALALKAMCYFQLLKVFSPAFSQDNIDSYGILLKETFTPTIAQERVSLSASVEAIEKILKEIKTDDDNIAWIGSDAIKYLQAELALWTGKYAEVLNYGLSLYKKYKEQVKKHSTALIWSNQKSPLRIFASDIENLNTRLYTSLEYSKEVGDYLMINENIVYEKDDNRNEIYTSPFAMTFGNTGNRKVSLLGKYNKQNKANETTNYYTKYRISGIYFMCAEAYVKLGKNEDAIRLINELLTERNSKPIPNITNNKDLLNRILLEKQKEFIGEPERFFDLKRNIKTIKRKITTSQYTIDNKDYRWTLPIPLSEKRYNRKITQNKGWEHINIVE